MNPAQSLHTSSWPSQCGPAPTEIVGIEISAVTLPAISDGTISSTTANAPGIVDGVGVVEQRRAPSPRPWMMWPPRPCSLCGVKPMCAITGMPARTIRLICFALRTPPSSFTA